MLSRSVFRIGRCSRGGRWLEDRDFCARFATGKVSLPRFGAKRFTRFYSLNDGGSGVVKGEEDEGALLRRRKLSKLLDRGIGLLDKGEFADAEEVLECVLAIQDDIGKTLVSDHEKFQLQRASTLANIAHCKQYQGKLQEAHRIYEEIFFELEKSSISRHSFGFVAHNYANLNAQLGFYEQAIKYGDMAIEILGDFHEPDSDVLLCLKSTMAGYMCGMKRYEEARVISEAVYREFLCRFGCDNDYTRAAYNNYHFVLERLGLEADMKALYDEWMIRRDEVWTVPTPSEEELDLLERRLVETFSPSLRMQQPGFVRSPRFHKTEIEGFVRHCRDHRIDVEHPALGSLWEREMANLKENQGRLENSLVMAVNDTATFLGQVQPMYVPIVEKMVMALPHAQEANERVQRERIERHSRLMEEHEKKRGEPKGPTPEFLERIEQMEMIKKERRAAQEAAARIAAEKAAREAAEKAAKEALLKSKKGKKK